MIDPEIYRLRCLWVTGLAFIGEQFEEQMKLRRQRGSERVSPSPKFLHVSTIVYGHTKWKGTRNELEFRYLAMTRSPMILR